MSRLLLEILTEEIPFLDQEIAENQIKKNFELAFINKNIKYDDIKILSTPRRVVVLIAGLHNKIEDIFEEKKGPKVVASEFVIQGFLASNNISLTDCFIKNINGNDFYFFKNKKEGGLIKNILPSIIIDEVLAKVAFKKSMKWNDSGINWSRPIRNLLVILEEDDADSFYLEINYAGVVSNNYTFGHRFLSEGKQLLVANIEEYFTIMSNNFVILGREERKQIILNQVALIEAKYSIKLHNADLVNEVCSLVEYPCILEGEIPDKYMILPQELLVTIIAKNQKYFNFVDSDGKLSNKIVIVANLKPKDGGKIITDGNLRVLKARLEDGIFFYNNDLKVEYADRLRLLENINFFEDVGSVYDKTQRVKDLFKKVFDEKENLLCDLYKNDLVSEVVFEMPELQGIMGYYYSKHSLYSNAISLAIRDHYKPQGLNDDLPETLLGAKLSFLDKLDTLMVFFSIGKKPSGSKDPFALRRSALGIIRISINYKFDLVLDNIIKSKDLLLFIKERLLHFLQGQYAKEVVNLVLKKHEKCNIYQMYLDVIYFNNLFQSKEGIVAMQMEKRLANILNSQKFVQGKIITELLITEEEEFLYKLLQEIKDNIIAFSEENDFLSSLKSIQGLEEGLDNFLTKVIINKSDTAEIKNNRLSLLQTALDLVSKAMGK